MGLADGAEFAGYRNIRLIGAGGMGEVYLAEHPRLPRQDALKILARDLSASGEFHERFIREADLAAKLFHPGIVGVHDRGDCDGQLWIAMDYVDGPDAAKLLRQRYPAGMPVGEVIAIIESVASALDYAHRSGLLHRDVKPANILLTAPEEDDQRVFLADFGISRQVGEISGLTATNLTLGTVAYSAPEQLMGGQVDGRADQYALGATAFHLLTGTQPYEGPNPVAVISNHLNAAIPRISQRRPDLATLDPVFAKVLAKQPESRFSTCREFAAALRQATPTLAIDDDRAAADPTMAATAFPSAPTRPAPAPDRPTQLAPAPPTGPDLPASQLGGSPAPPTPPRPPAGASVPQLAAGRDRERKARKRRTVILVALAAVVVLAAGLGIGYKVISGYYYVSTFGPGYCAEPDREDPGKDPDCNNVVIMRGVPGSILGLRLQQQYYVGCLTDGGEFSLLNWPRGGPTFTMQQADLHCKRMQLDDLRPSERARVKAGLTAGSVDDAINDLRQLANQSVLPVCVAGQGPGIACRRASQY